MLSVDILLFVFVNIYCEKTAKAVQKLIIIAIETHPPISVLNVYDLPFSLVSH
jgi:hypothetical protein